MTRPIVPWQRLSSQALLQTPFFTLRQDVCQLADGSVIPDYYVLEQPDTALVMAVTPAREVLFVQQYKHGAGRVLLELPGGICDGDDPLADARRELLEETGAVAGAWQALGYFLHDPTRANNGVHAFLAQETVISSIPQPDPAENIVVQALPLEQARRMALEGQFATRDTSLIVLLGCARLGIL